MASSEYLADELIDAVREEGLLPASDEESTTPKIRRILNREQRLYLAAFVRRAREGYFEDADTLTVVAGTTRYRLPTRATAAAVTLVEEVTSSTTRVLVPLTRKGAASEAASLGVGDFYFDGNYLVLVATPTSSASLRITYQRRLNKVVAAEEACVVLGKNTILKTVTLALASDDSNTTLPDTFVNGVVCDFIRGTPHFDVLAKDNAATVASNVLTFEDELPTELEVGDFVALAGETPVANMALELQDVLVLKAVHSYLSGGKDANAASLVKERLTQAEADALTLLTPRAKDTPPMVQNFYAPGYNRFRRWRRAGSF